MEVDWTTLSIMGSMGTLGALVGEALEYFHLKRQGRDFSFDRALITVVIAGVISTVYLGLIEKTPVPIVEVIHYGVFVAIFIEEITTTIQIQPVRAGAVPPLTGGASVLILSGFWQVYGVGAFGGFLIELRTLYDQRKQWKKLPVAYWILTAGMVVCSGFVAVIYGIHNVSGPLALQIGASTPLIARRLMR